MQDDRSKGEGHDMINTMRLTSHISAFIYHCWDQFLRVYFFLFSFFSLHNDQNYMHID